jgi:hypothetical protein
MYSKFFEHTVLYRLAAYIIRYVVQLNKEMIRIQPCDLLDGANVAESSAVSSVGGNVYPLLTLKMESVDFSATLLVIYHSLQCQTQRDRHLNFRRHKNIELRNYRIVNVLKQPMQYCPMIESSF